jgi:hypothetical protein
MSLLQQIWGVLLDTVTLGAERGNPWALGVLLIVGLAALFAGRQLFWLFAAAVGYVIGIAIAPLVVGPIPILGSALSLGIAVVVGLLAIAGQGVMARLIVFLAVAVITLLALTPFQLPWAVRLLVVAGGGLLGVLLLSAIYDPMLILLSAFYGSVAVLGAASRFVPNWQALENGLLFAGLLVAGILVQFLVLQRERANPLVVPASAGGVVVVERRARRFRRRNRPGVTPAGTPPELTDQGTQPTPSAPPAHDG